MEENNTTENSVEESQSPVEESTTEAAATEAPATAQTPVKKEGSVIRLNGGKIQTSLDKEELFKSWPDFNVGDTVKVHYRIVEGDKQRIQVYEGNVIGIRGEGLGKTMIVRRISHEVGVERIFPYHSPSIAKIEVSRKGKIRRSKLFYLRHKTGKGARIKEAVSAAHQAALKKRKEARKKA